MIKKFFITGTDTNVGKTFVSKILLRKASQIGYNTAGYKPVASGCKKTPLGFFNHDAIILRENSSVILDYQEVNPILFFENAPPHFLSKIYNRNIKMKNLSLGLKKIVKKSNWILIEGAGGWYTPISYQDTFSDWVKKEKLIVIIVIGIKLGCINHAILTEKAILSEKLECRGWIANHTIPEDKYNLYYIQTLQKYMNSPFLGTVPYLQKKNQINFKKIKIILPE
ncbi:dethiobiotin synthase [Buchnera aphidicola]|uniref:ATP-dependent dethiobiotin synthetase BioD n=1 Tax=Buchnera aphidicola (Lipaphis pseudobrassicae) TaxID=1258543 RepID=A0A4D6XWU1_9GAMM|nr:dethiobiotin synthase [Buchnera aphidicola]QCI22152.1 ATP-dependent dethiobiotin synthetase BioD [Buchnera aphidicola (Lipaphis pseudobrassicae)]